ncbi:transcription elongation factor elf1 like domain-containing protein [Hirsutella rhossiliensis]|uniref:Transcription elongation factor 1 homolog n=1 Tax=Hirsutella rhossiliensis TaxID=111463 RepID=A0A9P8SJQ5_9HYPO|nr:transcription elongation factor elf1 like domain-containing protein [Hirsutella rhossiliensis]KAH0964444.1 transcription elongation factor elf1 like domain-containing protein [Hirsutella rhossiliensis]
MGKRKKSSRKPEGPRKADPLPTTFTCLFCNHEKSVTVKLDRKAGVGQLDCRVCGQKFQCAVNYLSAAVDVYGEWVDAADAVAKEDTGKTGHGGLASISGSSKRDYRSGRPAAGESDDGHHAAGVAAADDELY